jgi:hypothetical protein
MPTQEHRNRLLNEVDITDHSFIEQYNRKRAPLKHLCRCLLANWNPKGNLGKTYEYVLEIADRPSRLGFPEFTLKYVCTVYEQDKIKISTDHYFIEQYNRKRTPLKHLCRCLLANWVLDQNLEKIFKVKLITDHSFIEQYNRKQAPLKHLCRCLLANWNLDQNFGRICNRRRCCP